MNWTPVTLLYPRRYLWIHSYFRDFNPREWSREYEWEQDEWNGWKDTLQPVGKTLTEQSGDCEDYAFVIASWAVTNGYDAKLGICFEGYRLAHVVATDGWSVYSSGVIYTDTTLDEYIEKSDYDRIITRNI